MTYLVVGLNHKTAPVDVREKLNFSREEIPQALRVLLAQTRADEGLILSTCNRVEVYTVQEQTGDGVEKVRHFLTRYHRMEDTALDSCCYHYTDREAVRHLFRVASSLDSMVVGEPQITGQVKQAYRQALASKTSGIYLNRCLERALFVSKKIREETRIGEKNVSVGSAAVRLAKQIFADLKNKKVLLIGAGKIGELVVFYLEEEGCQDIFIVNRSYEKALELAEEGVGIPVPFDNLRTILEEADLVISSVAVETPLISRQQMDALMEMRKNRPIFLIDLGVPRNIEPAVGQLDNVYLYNIDDLNQISRSHQEERIVSSRQAEEIIEKEVLRFFESMVGHEPVLSLLGKKFESIRRRELARTLGKLGHLNDEEKQAIDKCTESIVNKILYDPAVSLKLGKVSGLSISTGDFLKRLFRLDDEE